MEIRQPSNSKDAINYNTTRLREEFLVPTLFVSGQVNRVYSHIDRIITMGYCPAGNALEVGEDLNIMKNLGTNFFLERRELGVINVGGSGKVTVDGQIFKLDSLDGLYVGMGGKEVLFESDDVNNPAKYYALSAPAHKTYPNVHIDINKAKKVEMGTDANANKRVINQYIHPDVLDTCQLCMGMTALADGNVWNTMPCHTHERRMEVYFYFDVKDDNVVFHYMGEPEETRHMVVRNEQAVISPSWSIHSGCGTKNYKFIWGMVGENKTFDDMDHVSLTDIR